MELSLINKTFIEGKYNCYYCNKTLQLYTYNNKMYECDCNVCNVEFLFNMNKLFEARYHQYNITVYNYIDSDIFKPSLEVALEIEPYSSHKFILDNQNNCLLSLDEIKKFVNKFEKLQNIL